MRLRHELAIVLLLLVLAAPARLLGLEFVPPGLFHDEAYEGIDARRIVMGARPVFLAENYGREPLYAYFMALLIAIDGPTVAAVRATSALFGLLLVPAAYFWGRVFFGPTLGLLIAALSTISYWTLHESRLGLRPIALPVFLALTSGLVWLATRYGRWWAWPLAGLCLGLGFYSYLPVRLFPLVVAAQVAIGTRAHWRESGKRWDRLMTGAGLLIVVLALTTAPLLLYFRANPDDAIARSDVVSIFAANEGRANPMATLGRSLLLNLGMFTWRGDDTVRHNLPFRPVFDPLLVPFLLTGLVLSWRQPGRAAWLATWTWLGVMLAPGVLSDSAPHFLRTIGLLPALFVLPALGLDLGARWLAGLIRRRSPTSRANLLAVGGIVAVLAMRQGLAWYDYFVVLPRQPGLAEAFDAPRAALARVAGDPPPGTPLDLPTPGWSYATIRFLRPHTFEDPRPAQQVQARFANNVVLLGYDLAPVAWRGARSTQVSLYWQALREMPASYSESLRVLDDYGRVWWERTGVPGAGTLPTDTWLPGEVVTDRLQVELIDGAPTGDYLLELALSQPDGGRRFSIFDSAGRQIGTSLRLPGLRLARAPL
jgi:4-amino-4-deoxy-L-arabinose transferase-like glycosyltransferase